jgi:DNA processing protein
MNWEPNAADTKKKAKVRLELSAFDAQERSVLEVLYEKSHMLVDELSWKSQLPMGILATTLLGLEFKGVIQSLPGKAYKLVRD